MRSAWHFLSVAHEGGSSCSPDLVLSFLCLCLPYVLVSFDLTLLAASLYPHILLSSSSSLLVDRHYLRFVFAGAYSTTAHIHTRSISHASWLCLFCCSITRCRT